jgi:acyl-CoA synthetase (AMP-forming)/AMP-acid ligase II
MEPSQSRSDRHLLDTLLLRQASARSTAPFLLDARSGRTLTFVELLDNVARLRNRLRTWGVQRGDRVGLHVADPLTFSAWFIAGVAMGAWVAPLESTLGDANLVNTVARARDLELRVMLSDRDAPGDTSVAWRNIREIDNDVSSLSVLASADEGSSGGGVVLASSGTTGAPKVVALSVAQLLATAELVARHHQLGVTDRGFNPLPLWHVNAEVVGVLATLYAGSSLVLDDRFHRTGFWKIVSDFDVTWINAVPAIISRLTNVNDDEVPSTDVRFIRSASAPLAPALLERFEASTGIPVIQSYGMTEAASQICATPLTGVRKSASVGVAVGVDVRVVTPDRDERATGPDHVGHIEIKGPTVITRYESPAYDDRFDADGWLRTGDLGYFDEDGYLFIVGRSDDVINRGGEKIYPLEIENVLVTVAGVVQVAVVGEPDDVFGHVPVAYVRFDEGTLDSPGAMADLVERVRRSAKTAFAKAHRPVSVRVVESFPAHATGKIRKGLLRGDDVTVLHQESL